MKNYSNPEQLLECRVSLVDMLQTPPVVQRPAGLTAALHQITGSLKELATELRIYFLSNGLKQQGAKVKQQ